MHNPNTQTEFQQMIECRQVEAEAEAAKLREEESFNNQFLKLFGQFVQILGH